MKQTPLNCNLIKYGDMVFDIGTYASNSHLLELFESNQYERSEIWLVDNFLNKELPIVELGGSIGVVSCIINKLLHYPEKHIVVEANSLLIPLLRNNKKHNRCRFQIVNAAIGYDSHFRTLHVSTRNPCMGNAFVELDNRIQVRTVGLKKLLSDNDLQNICLVTDIEGAEHELFNNELEVIIENVKLLIFESHPEYLGAENVRAQLKLLIAHGFEMIFHEGDFHVLINKTL